MSKTIKQIEVQNYIVFALKLAELLKLAYHLNEVVTEMIARFFDRAKCFMKYDIFENMFALKIEEMSISKARPYEIVFVSKLATEKRCATKIFLW